MNNDAHIARLEDLLAWSAKDGDRPALRAAIRALSADRGEAVAVPQGWSLARRKNGVLIAAPDGSSVLADPGNASIAGVVLWDLVNALLSATPPSPAESAEGDVTPLSDVTLLRALCEDVTDMHPTVREQLRCLAKRIESGAAIGATRCRKCGEKVEVTMHSADAAAPSQVSDADRWYLGAMNDGLFIINRPPSPAGTDVGPWMNPNGPTVVLNVTDLPQEKAQAIVDAHNAKPQPGRVEGMVLVPRIPTDAMRGAWIEHRPDDASFYDADLASVIGWANETWDAMLAAAPTAGGAK